METWYQLKRPELKTLLRKKKRNSSLFYGSPSQANDWHSMNEVSNKTAENSKKTFEGKLCALANR